MNHKAINQLLSAALVDRRFSRTLLAEPEKAISTGYLDHRFDLTKEEFNLINSIHAKSLEEFARQVYDWISLNGNRDSREDDTHRYAGVSFNQLEFEHEHALVLTGLNRAKRVTSPFASR